MHVLGEPTALGGPARWPRLCRCQCRWLYEHRVSDDVATSRAVAMAALARIRARWRVTQRETLLAISERYNVGITARGTYIPSTRQPAAGERKLHLFIEGMSLQDVENAKAELQRVAEEATQSARPEGRSYGKYQV
jgi:hypothetical protein